MTKKVLSIILTAVMLLSVFTVLSITAAAEEADLADVGATIISGIAGPGTNYSVDTRAGVTDYQLTISGNGDTADCSAYAQGLSTAPWMTYADQIGVIIIESGVKVLGRNFFSMNKGTTASVSKSLSMGGSVTKISERAFYYANLDSAYLAASPNLVQIDANAFAGNLFTTLALPEKLSVIGKYAFADCKNLTKVTLPASLSMIDDYAFSGCTALKTVIYQGARAQYNSLYKGAGNTGLTNATVICTDDIRIENTSPKKGDNLVVSFYGDLASMSSSQRTITWQRSANESADFYNVSGNANGAYTLTDKDYNKYFRAKVTINATGEVFYSNTVLFDHPYVSGTIHFTVKEPEAGDVFSESSCLAASSSDNANVKITGISYYAGHTSIKEGALFEEYTTYEIRLSLQTINDAYFGPDLDTVAFRINGKNANAGFTNISNASAYGVTFTTGKSINKLSTVNVTFTEPAAGAKPDFSVSKDEEKCRFYLLSEHHTGLEFVNKATGNTMQATETFVSGKVYTATVYLTTQAEGLVSTFEPDVKVNFNGKAATVDWINEKWLIVTYDYVPVSSAGYTISGTATSFLEETDNTTIALSKKSGEDYVFQGMRTISGNSGSYSFSGLSNGQYKLRVSKNNHVTREYNVTILLGSKTQDVTICPKGDVTGDGKVTNADYSRVNQHVCKVKPLTDYALLCGDVVGSSDVTNADLARINQHVCKTKPLW